MDKNKFLSDKIKALKKQGKTGEQALITAYGMWQSRHSQELPKHQVVGTTSGDKNPMFQTPGQMYGFESSIPEQFLPKQPQSEYEAMMFPNPEERYGNINPTSARPVNTYPTTQPTNTAPTAEVGERTVQKALESGMKSVSSTFETPEEYLQKTSQGVVDKIPENLGVTEGEEVEDETNNFQLMNPHGGVSLEQSLAFAARGFGRGDIGEGVIGSGLSLLKGARTIGSGYGAGRQDKLRKEEERKLYDKNQKYQTLQKGGTITNAEMLTGNYITDEENPNVEIEKGEHIQNSETGEIQEAIGETHEKGGVEVNLPNESRVLSDYTKIGKDNAKLFKEQFGVKLKAKDTFATVMDKVNKSIGMDDVVKEEAKGMEDLEYQLTDADMKNNVKEINVNFLQDQLIDTTEKKKTIKEQQDEAFAVIFEEQEKIPKEGEYAEEGLMKFGGEIKSLAKKYGLDHKRVMELMQEGGLTQGQVNQVNSATGIEFTEEGANKIFQFEEDLEAPQYPKLDLGRFKDVGYLDVNMTGDQYNVSPSAKNLYNAQNYKYMIAEIKKLNPNAKINSKYINRDEMLKRLKEQEGENNKITQNLENKKEGGELEDSIGMEDLKTSFEGGGSFRDVEELKHLARQLGYKGNFDFKVDGEKVNEELRKMQEFIAKEDPDIIKKYFEHQPITADGLDFIFKNSPETFKAAGVSPKGNLSNLSREERLKVQKQYDSEGKVPEDFYINQFVDGRWNYRGPAKAIDSGAGMSYKTPGPEAGKVAQFTPLKQKEIVEGEAKIEGSGEAEKSSGDTMGLANLPYEYVMPPGTRDSVYRAEADLTRLNPIKGSAEPYLAEIEQQRGANAQALAYLPQAQQAAALAAALGTSQEAANKAIAGITQADHAEQARVQQYNAQVTDKENLLEQQFAQDYEKKVFAGKNAQEANVRAYFDKLNANQKQNYQDVNNLNLLNALYPNFNTDGSQIKFNNQKLAFQNTEQDPAILAMFDGTKEDAEKRKAYMKAHSKRT